MIKIQNKKINFVEYLVIIIFFLFITNPYGFGFYLYFIIIPIVFIHSWRENFKRNYLITCAILLIFGVIFGIITFYYDYYGFNSTLTVLLFPLTLYIFGYKFSEHDYTYYKSNRLLTFLLVSLSLFIFISYLKTLAEYGNLDSVKSFFGERSLADIWQGNEIRATVVTVYLSFSLAALPLVFIRYHNINKKKMYLYKMLILFCFISSLFITVQLASRTALIIPIASSIAVYLFSYKLSLKKIFLPIVLIFLCAVGWVLFNLNIFGLKSWWIGTSVYLRLKESGLDSPRYMAWEKILKELFEYPFGERKIDITLSYAHNLWLDVAYDSGLISFFLLLVFSIIALVSFVNFIRLNHPVFMKSLIITFYTAILISFMTEPILATRERVFFLIFCLLVGVTQSLNNNLINNKH